MNIINGILLSHKNNEIMPFAATWMDLGIIILSIVNQRKINIVSLNMWNLKKDTNELNYKTNRFTDIENKLQFSSVTQLCPTLYDPMNRSTPGLPVHHHLPEFTQTHIH